MSKQWLAAVVIAVIAIVVLISITGMNFAQDSNGKKVTYDVKTFMTHSVNATGAVERFDQEIRKWLKDHPEIEIVACSEAMTKDVWIWTKTIYYKTPN